MVTSSKLALTVQIMYGDTARMCSNSIRPHQQSYWNFASNIVCVERKSLQMMWGLHTPCQHFSAQQEWVISSYSEGLYNVEVIGILFNICVSNGDLKKCCSQLIVINVEELYNTWAPRRWPFDPRRILKHDCWWTRAFDVGKWDCAIHLACLDDGASEDSPF